jgi:hypothetical protein
MEITNGLALLFGGAESIAAFLLRPSPESFALRSSRIRRRSLVAVRCIGLMICLRERKGLGST